MRSANPAAIGNLPGSCSAHTAIPPAGKGCMLGTPNEQNCKDILDKCQVPANALETLECKIKEPQNTDFVSEPLAAQRHPPPLP